VITPSLLAFAFLLSVSATADERPAGTVLPVPPSVAPGGMTYPADDPVAAAREWFLQGDMDRVVALLTPHLAAQRSPVSRDGTAAHLMLGLAHREKQNWNLASAHFWWVRTSGQPLSPFGAWHEAQVELSRGRAEAAIEACGALRESWPSHRRADECLLLLGDAWAVAGDRTQSAQHFNSWLAAHPDSPRVEAVRLRAALARARVDPKGAVRPLQQLVLDHDYYTSAVSAQLALEVLAEQGLDTTLPTDTRSEIRRIESATRSGRLNTAWAGFQALAARADDDPAALRWTQKNEVRMAKSTRQWSKLAELLQEQYANRATASTAWKIFNAWARAGEWSEAVAWGRKGLSTHGGRGRWSSGQDDVAWAEIHNGEFDAAHDRWSSLASSRGSFGKNARFYSAFSAFRAGDLKAAESGFKRVIDFGRSWSAAGYYWRARVRDAAENPSDAEADRKLAIASDRTGWYTALLADRTPTDTAQASDEWTDRNGRWKRQPIVTLPTFRAPAVAARDATGVGRVSTAGLVGASTISGWAQLTWPNPGEMLPPATAPSPGIVSIPGTVPDGYRPSQWFDAATAGHRLKEIAERHNDIWPELNAAHDLARAGLVSEASRIISEVYKEWKRPGRRAGSSSERTAKLRQVRITMNEWRQFFALARDHYHTAISAIGLDRELTQEAEIRDANRLAYPIVDGPALWQLGNDFGVDPLLMMSIMRQESTYRATIKSRAGAIGLVQVMPGTGARLAWLMGDESYSPGALENPAVNMRYGTYYMSLLLDRFDGVFPMAIASYNGGPHNVSRWYREHQGSIAIDEWVEQIQWRETRNYVKKVVGHYTRYVDLYGPEGARLQLPRRPLGDDPTVVDF